jgi:hypothetical protein
MARKISNTFAPVNRFFEDVTRTIILAREVNSLYSTPESVFRARGTTRDAAIRALAKRL